MWVTDCERRLITQIARSQSLAEVLEHDLQPQHFMQRTMGDRSPEPLPGEVYEWMLEHLRRYRSIPSMDLLMMRFPLFQPAASTDSIGSLMEAMMRQINRTLLIAHIRELSEVADDPARVIDASTYALESARELARSLPGSKVTRFSDALSMLDLYREREATGFTPGISFGMDWIDDLTYGVQTHEMAIIEGFLGVAKSSLSIKMCADAYFLRDQTPMVFAFEMEAHKLVQKWIAMCAQFEYRAIKRGKLTEDEKRRWHEIGEKAVASRFEKDVIVIDDERRPTEDFIYSQIEQHRPSMVVVDTLDEVRAPSHIKAFHEKADYVARELKGIARATNIPMIVVAQAGRGAAQDGATIENIAGSITIARKADIIIGIHSTDQMKANHMREFTILKNRDDGGEGTKRTMYFHPGSMILRPWLPSDNAPAPVREVV